MLRLKKSFYGLFGLIVTLMIVATISIVNDNLTAQAASQAISFKQAKSILKRGGYSDELQWTHLKSKSAKRTVITTMPGAKGKDIFMLVRHGKYVKISAVIGTLDGGHFSTDVYSNLPRHKTVLAKAPAWHTGTPKVLRYKWVTKTDGMHFYKNQIVVWDRTVGWIATSHPWINVKYQKLGKNKYKTHAYCPREDRHYTTTWRLSGNHRSIKVNGGTYYRSN